MGRRPEGRTEVFSEFAQNLRDDLFFIPGWIHLTCWSNCKILYIFVQDVETMFANK